MQVLKTEGFNNIFHVDVFEKEFCSLFGKSKGEMKRYQNWLDRSLGILDELGVQATDNKTFRKISGYEDLYEIRYPHSKLNTRALHCILLDDGEVILLAATKEKESSDVSSAAELAARRLRLLKEG